MDLDCKNEEIKSGDSHIEKYNVELARAKTHYLQKLYLLRKQKRVIQRKISRLNNIIRLRRDVLPLDAIPELQ